MWVVFQFAGIRHLCSLRGPLVRGVGGPPPSLGFHVTRRPEGAVRGEDARATDTESAVTMFTLFL